MRTEGLPSRNNKMRINFFLLGCFTGGKIMMTEGDFPINQSGETLVLGHSLDLLQNNDVTRSYHAHCLVSYPHPQAG